MAKSSRIIATYKLNADEYVQVVVHADSSYPEALAVARANAIGGVSEMLADVLAQTRSDEAEAPTDAPTDAE